MSTALISPSAQNGFTFQIKNPSTSKNIAPPNMVAMKRIDNYSYALTDEIGLGFTSHVYKGKCQLTNEQVAVKVIELKNNEDELHSNLLKDEVAVLQTIKTANSRNLLRLERVIKSKNNLYIITEFCQGNDLAKILRKKKIFSEVEGQSIMKQVLNGYKELYKLKIVHRDLKLANFFITRGQVKIADFGFAISEMQASAKMDYNVGSPYYMPPQSLKFNEYSYLSDVWAFGVIAYQLVYGKVPWKDKDDEILYHMIHNNPIDLMFDQDRDISEHYKKFIRACLTIDKRFRGTPEFIINYQWPQAQDYVQGLQEQQPASHNFQHSASGKNLQYQPRISLNPSQNKRKQLQQQIQIFRNKRTPSVDNLSGIKKKERQEQQILDNMVRLKSVEKKTHRRMESKEISQPVNRQEEENCNGASEKTILGQLHYCRFMADLADLLRSLGWSIPSDRVLVELSERVAEKMRVLVRLAQNQEDLFGTNDFKAYVKTERWENIRQLIYKYDLKFRDLHFNQGQILKSEQNQDLIDLIRTLKANFGNGSNIKVLEFLTYYYQLKHEDVKGEFSTFLDKTKVNYLVDECRHYMTQPLPSQTSLQGQQRLMAKLALLGL